MNVFTKCAHLEDRILVFHLTINTMVTVVIALLVNKALFISSPKLIVARL